MTTAMRPATKAKWTAHGIALALQLVPVLAIGFKLGSGGKFGLGPLFALIAAAGFVLYAAVLSGVAYFLRSRVDVLVMNAVVAALVGLAFFSNVQPWTTPAPPRPLPVIPREELPRLMAEAEARQKPPPEPTPPPRAEPPPPPPAEVRQYRPSGDELLIRLANEGDVELKGLEVDFRGQRVPFGDLRPSQASEYVKVGSAHGYAFIEARAGGKRVVLQPVDFVGEKLLEPGYYTWRVKLDPEEGRLRQRSERD